MWFCTPDGLNRYDGYHFKIYRHDDADSFSVSSNLVTKFFIDTHKNAWIATNDNGLNYFDIPHQRFYHFFLGLTINDIVEDKYQNLIVASGGKIILCKIKKIEGVQFKKISLDTATFLFQDAVINRDGYIHYHLFTDTWKNVYLTTTDAIFKLVYDENTNKLATVKLFSFSETEATEPQIAEDRTTHKFYACLQSHLLEFPDSNFRHSAIIATLPYARVVLIDSKQRLWHGASLVSVVNLRTRSVTQVLPKSLETGNLLNGVYSCFEDRSGNLWLGTSGLGILKFTDDLNVFHHILPNMYVYHIQAYNGETALVEGYLKLRLNSNNSFQLDSVTIPGEIKKPFYPSAKYVVDAKGGYWFLYNNQLKSYSAENKNLRIISIKDKLRRETIAAMHINVSNTTKLDFLFIDEHDNLWFQCYSKMMSYNIAADSLSVYPSLPVFKDEDRSFQIMYEDVNRTLWITTSKDFYSYNPYNNSTKFFYHDSNDTSTVVSSNVSCFCDDPLQPAQFLWIGTRGSGLSRLNKLTGKCTSLSVKNGLPNNVIYGLLTDDEGDLWGSTNKGLFRLKVKTGKIKNFDVTDGLQGNEFNRFAYLKLGNGMLIFGGLNGVNYFRPGDIHPISPPGVVVLTNIKIPNRNLSVNEPNSAINEDVSYLKDLAIQSNQNVIGFEFAAMDYRKAGAAHYRYRLNGFDHDWNNSGLNNTATYTNLDPGNYTFLVQASNDNTTWSNDFALLNLHVLPMWWQTWLFKIIIACCIVAIGYTIYRYRLQQLLKIERVRNNIARDLHDEIGSSLSSISIFSKLAQRHINTKEANPDLLLQKINEDASHVMDSMSDIVWSINTKNDEFENVFYRMRGHAVQLLEAKNYIVHFHFDDRLNHVKFDMLSRHDFYLIYKEALNNIVKYAEGENVWIELALNNNKIELVIKDDGKGFDVSKANRKGNGLSNMHKRADAIGARLDITSAINGGSTLHLSFQRK